MPLPAMCSGVDGEGAARPSDAVLGALASYVLASIRALDGEPAADLLDGRAVYAVLPALSVEPDDASGAGGD